MWKVTSGAVIAVSLLAGGLHGRSALAADPPEAKTGKPMASEKDAKTTLAALRDINHTLLSWGQLGTEKASSVAVREYAGRLSTEVQALDAKVIDLARSRNVPLSGQYSTFYDLGRRIQLETMKIPAGRDFDHSWTSVTTRVHPPAG